MLLRIASWERPVAKIASFNIWHAEVLFFISQLFVKALIPVLVDCLVLATIFFIHKIAFVPTFTTFRTLDVGAGTWIEIWSYSTPNKLLLIFFLFHINKVNIIISRPCKIAEGSATRIAFLCALVSERVIVSVKAFHADNHCHFPVKLFCKWAKIAVSFRDLYFLWWLCHIGIDRIKVFKIFVGTEDCPNSIRL